VRDLLIFTLSEALSTATEFKDVLGEFSLKCGGCPLAELLCPIEPKVDFFEHLMDAATVLECQHLLQSGHLVSGHSIDAYAHDQRLSKCRKRL